MTDAMYQNIGKLRNAVFSRKQTFTLIWVRQLYQSVICPQICPLGYFLVQLFSVF